MSCFTRCLLRYGVIGGLALGGITLLVGPERVAAGISQIRTKAQSVVDTKIDDPMALRRQLEQLAGEYPDRIAEVEGELAEVDHQIAQFKADIDFSNEVVAITTEDLNTLKTAVAQAEAETKLASNTGRAVFIRFDGIRFSIDEAYDEGRRINEVRSSYQDRVAHDRMQIEFLAEQKERLAEIHSELSKDFATYKNQLWQLDRQIDAIARNDRLIELTKQQQATLDSYDRFGKVENLHQIESKLAEMRAKQEAQLRQLQKTGRTRSYKEKAYDNLRQQTAPDDDNPFDIEIEVGGDDDDEAEVASADDTFAFAGPRIIEAN